MDLKVIKLTKVLKLNMILTVIGCFIFLFGKEVVLVDKQYILADNNQNSKPNWKTIGQGGGGNIVDVVCHPTDSNIVWVVTDLTGIFKSKDGGITYDRMSGAIEQQELLFEWMRGMDHELAYDLSDPNIMYWAMDGGIYVDPGLYKSEDGGETWFKIPGSPDLAPGSIVVDHNGVIYGVKHRSLYISKDKGSTWVKKPDVPTYYCENEYNWRRRFRIFIYTSTDNKIFIGDRRKGSGIFYSTDMGDTWTNVLAGYEIMDIAASPNDPNLIMAFENDGDIFRSDDGGKKFTTVESIEHDYYKWGVWPAFYGGIEINKDGHVMAIGRWEMAISKDTGLTFEVYKEDDLGWDPADYIFPNRKSAKSLLKCNKLSSTASGKWIFVDGHLAKISNDNGLSWSSAVKGIDILCVYAPPVVDKTNPEVIHVGVGDNGYCYTTDNGKTWKTPEKKMGNVDGVAQDPNNPDIFYKLYGRTKNRGGIFKSEDRGVTWEKLSSIPMPEIPKRTEMNPTFYSGWIGRLHVDPTNSKRIYATHRASNGIYKSEDGGDSFERVLKLVRPWELKVTETGTVFVSTWDSKGLFRSKDNGATFEKIHEGMVHDFVVHPENDDIVYVNVGSFNHAWATAKILPNYELNRDHGNQGKGKLYKTNDGGKNWALLGSYDGFAIYIEPNFPNVMLMSTRDGGQGIVRSMDAGKTWKSIHYGHDNYHPRGFVYGGVPGRVYTWNHNLSRIDNIQFENFTTENKH